MKALNAQEAKAALVRSRPVEMIVAIWDDGTTRCVVPVDSATPSLCEWTDVNNYGTIVDERETGSWETRACGIIRALSDEGAVEFIWAD